MSMTNGLFTPKAVSQGHPDKLCDRISDAILEDFIRRDPCARMACETFVMDGKFLVAVESRTRREEDFEVIRRAAPVSVRPDPGWTYPRSRSVAANLCRDDGAPPLPRSRAVQMGGHRPGRGAEGGPLWRGR